MRMLRGWLLSIWLVLTLWAQAFATPQSRSFPLPDVPDNLRTPKDRAEYIALHYWDKYPFGAPPVSEDMTLLEQGFVDFIDLLSIVNAATAVQASEKLLAECAGNPANKHAVLALAEKYLYDSESPFASEELYFPYLQFQIDENGADALRLRGVEAQKNRPGTRATDIAFITVSGEKSSIAELKNKKIVMIFVDPECDNCRNLISRLSKSSDLAEKIKNREVAVVLLSLSEKKSALQVPSDWIVGLPTDMSMLEEDYSIRALPDMYLIDTDGKVMLKNMRPQGLAMALQLTK